MARIHSSAIVDSSAQLADDVEVGAFSVIGPRVSIGAGTKIGPHCLFEGRTAIGANNVFYAYCSVGGPPQDKKYAGEDTQLVIGDRNTVREFATINLGTTQDQGVTRIGNDNWLMAYIHIAHDCVIGNNIILANSAQLAGHVHVDDWAIVGGMSGVHQFVRIGMHSMVAGGTALVQDVAPFVIGGGAPPQSHTINVEGLRRRGFSAETIAALRRAFKTIFKEGLTVAEACAAVQAQTQALAGSEADAAPHLRTLCQFIQASKRGITR
jgi:UDP-N-acetylglucosamine acyltransferase